VTLQEFTLVFTELALQLRFKEWDEADLRAYYRALQDLDVFFVATAGGRLARTGGWFPKTPEWRAEVQAVIRERRKDQDLRLRARAVAGLPPLCPVCNDTGWNSTEAGAVRCRCDTDRWQEMRGLRPMPPAPALLPESHDPASAALQKIEQRFGIIPIRSMPPLRQITREERQQVIKLAQEIQVSAERCAALDCDEPVTQPPTRTIATSEKERATWRENVAKAIAAHHAKRESGA
jgi:hypothetical protein